MEPSLYEKMVSDAAAIADVFFDLTGGRWTLALFCETLEKLLTTNNISGAATVIQKLYEAAEQPLTWVNQLDAEHGVLFSNILIDILSPSRPIVL